MDTAKAEARMKALTLRICVDHGVNATIKFGKSHRVGGTQRRYHESHVHVVTYSKVQLADYAAGRPWYSGYKYTMHLWARYGKLYGARAEWALVIHEMAHAIDCERNDGEYGDRLNGARRYGQRQFHLAEFQAIVRELQDQYPPPAAASFAEELRSKFTPPAVWVKP